MQNLKVFTAGAVIRQGEPLLDIVPVHEGLIVHAQVQPIDAANIREGLIAEVRLTSFTMWRMPIIMGASDVSLKRQAYRRDIAPTLFSRADHGRQKQYYLKTFAQS